MIAILCTTMPMWDFFEKKRRKKKKKKKKKRKKKGIAFILCLKWLTTRALRTCDVECGKETDLLFYVHVVEVHVQHWRIKLWKWRSTARNRKADTDRCSRERKQKHTHTSVMMERFDCGLVSVRTFRGSLLPQARTLSARPLPQWLQVWCQVWCHHSLSLLIKRDILHCCQTSSTQSDWTGRNLSEAPILSFNYSSQLRFQTSF